MGKAPLSRPATRVTVVISYPPTRILSGFARTCMKYSKTIITMLFAIAPVSAMAQTAPHGGKEIFEQMCAGCHGTQGNGQEGTKRGFVARIGTLANKEDMNSLPDDYLKIIIKKGCAHMGTLAAMPAREH